MQEKKPNTVSGKKKKGFLYIATGLIAVLCCLSTASCLYMDSNKAPVIGSSSKAGTSPVQDEDSSKNDVPPGVRVVDFGKDLERWDEAKQELLEAVRNMEPAVYVKNKVRFDWSDLDVSCFWVSGITDRVDSIEPEEGQAYAYGGLVSFEYNCEMADIPAMQKEIDQVTAAILAKIPADADEWETAKIVHDEICRLAAYDDSLDGPHIRDIYGTLVKRSAVCVGYAYAFDYVLEQAPNAPQCITRESADRTHAWNEVTFQNGDGKSYLYIDPTWNDTDMTDAKGNPYIMYDYFGVSPEELDGVDDSHTIGFVEGGEDPTPFYYHVRQGCFMTSYNETEATNIFSRQYRSGGNMLTLRFQNTADYTRAKVWTDNDCAELNNLLSHVGYSGSYLYWWNDDMQILNIGLYPSAA